MDSLEYESVARRIDGFLERAARADTPDERWKILQYALELMCSFIQQFNRDLAERIERAKRELELPEQATQAALSTYVDSVDGLDFLRSEAALRQFLESTRPLLEISAGANVDALIRDLVRQWEAFIDTPLATARLAEQCDTLEMHFCGKPPAMPRPAKPKTRPPAPGKPADGGERAQKWVTWATAVLKLIGAAAGVTRGSTLESESPREHAAKLELLSVLVAAWIGRGTQGGARLPEPTTMRIREPA